MTLKKRTQITKKRIDFEPQTLETLIILQN